MKTVVSTILVATSLMASSSGYSLVKGNGCLSCHAIASKKTAPAFAGIAKKNIRFYGNNAKNMIIQSIKNGSSGKYRKFADVSMPSYFYLSQEQLDTIADFILSQASKARGNGGMGKGHGMGGMNKGRMF